MLIRNRRRDAHPANLTLHQFGDAMSQLNLDNVPPHARARAILDHLARIMSTTITDPTVRAEVSASRVLHTLDRPKNK
jgi:hypothetical protein